MPVLLRGLGLLLLLAAAAGCPAPAEPPSPPGPADAAASSGPGEDAGLPGPDGGPTPGPDAAGAGEGADAAAGDGPDAAAPCDEGQACDDGDLCTENDRCFGGICRGTARPCTAPPGQCLQDVGACEPATGECVYPPRPQGIDCSDGDECTLGDACDGAGACVAGARKQCLTPPFDCRAVPGTCDPSTGQCVWANAPAGAACDDGEPCTEGDSCDADGICRSGTPVACDQPPDSCHRTDGWCDPEQGCLYSLKPAGSGCDDGNPCTLAESCDAAGACGGGVALVCATPPTSCFRPDGTCLPASGCVYEPQPPGEPCADGDPCTTADACDGAGTCVGTPRACAAPGPCWDAACDSADGQCKDAPKAAGTACEVPNGTAACDGAGACAVAACDPGFSPLAGGCASFALGYQSNASACLSCGAPNPHTAACSCPPGFAAQGLRGVSDCAGAGTHVNTTPQLCQVAVFSPAESDWAGAWQEDDAVACGEGCRSANPVTVACSCPPGTDVVIARVEVSPEGCPTQIIGSRIGVCVNTSGPVTSFAGAYQEDDAGEGSLGCRSANPRTGGCSCPPETTPRLRLRLLAPGAGSSEVGSNLYFCAP